MHTAFITVLVFFLCIANATANTEKLDLNLDIQKSRVATFNDDLNSKTYLNSGKTYSFEGTRFGYEYRQNTMSAYDFTSPSNLLNRGMYEQNTAIAEMSMPSIYSSPYRIGDKNLKIGMNFKLPEKH
jgi:hypothetical protein